MEMLLYLLSNLCANAAGFILLWHYYIRDKVGDNKKKGGQSRDAYQYNHVDHH